jgi:ribosomal protein S18 acetylase RimI-like enzyme
MEMIAHATAANREHILNQLRRNSVRNSWAIQDLTIWPERTRLSFIEANDQFSYLMMSGHPATHDQVTLIMDGTEEHARLLLRELKVTEPFLMRETPLRLAPLVKEQYPDAKVFPQYRMDVSRSTFKPQHKGLARPLKLDDAPALAAFFGAPPHAAKGFEGWLRGSKLFYGIFESSQLVAIGSSMVSIPESWNLVSIETHKDFRGRGLATEITSTLIGQALEKTSTVTCTVAQDNLPAIRCYQKVGLANAEERAWIDHGTGATP